MSNNRSSRSQRRQVPERPTTTESQHNASPRRTSQREAISLRDQATNRLPELHPPAASDDAAVRQTVQREAPARRGRFGGFVENYRGHGDEELATAIAFNALAALVPLVMLVFLTLSLVIELSSIRGIVEDVLGTFLSDADVDATIDFIQRGQGSATGISLVTIIGLGYGGHRLFNGINQALSSIYHVSGRIPARQKLAGMIMAPAVALLMLLSAVMGCATTIAFIFPSYFGIDTDPTWPAAVAGHVIAFIVSLMVGSVIFSVFPRDEPAEAVGPGAMFFAVSFSLLSQLFALFAWLARGADPFTGVLALVLILLVWLYLLGQIIVVGAEINGLVADRRTTR